MSRRGQDVRRTHLPVRGILRQNNRPPGANVHKKGRKERFRNVADGDNGSDGDDGRVITSGRRRDAHKRERDESEGATVTLTLICLRGRPTACRGFHPEWVEALYYETLV